jgi:tRNA (adenine57-N1/adenine58-N1)-methyltransferase
MPTTGSAFGPGESCLLIDDRDKQYLLKLKPGREFQFDKGVIRHDDLIGSPEGHTVTSSKGWHLYALRPRLADYTLRMKRGAAVMYPKDSGAVVMWTDIRPGCRVLEAGTGSGAMAMALSRAVGESGSVVTTDTRADHQTHAKKLMEQFGGEIPHNIEFRTGDVADHLADVQPDRIVLDLPEPWHCAEAAPDHVKPGGVFASYLPTIPQVELLRKAMDKTGAYIEVDTFEVLMRSWTVSGRSVRPDHRMVGHTGFITIGRVVSPKP